MDLNAYVHENIERVPYTVTNLAGVELGEGWLDIDVATVTQGFLLAVSNATVEEGETADDAARRLAAMTISPIRGWDLTRGDDPVPVTVDEYLALPVQMVTAMGEAMGSVANPKAKNAGTSAGGSLRDRRS